MEVLNLQLKKSYMEAVDLYTGQFLFLITKTELTLGFPFLCFLNPSELHLCNEQR